MVSLISVDSVIVASLLIAEMCGSSARVVDVRDYHPRLIKAFTDVSGQRTTSNVRIT